MRNRSLECQLLIVKAAKAACNSIKQRVLPYLMRPYVTPLPVENKCSDKKMPLSVCRSNVFDSSEYSHCHSMSL